MQINARAIRRLSEHSLQQKADSEACWLRQSQNQMPGHLKDSNVPLYLTKPGSVTGSCIASKSLEVKPRAEAIST